MSGLDDFFRSWNHMNKLQDLQKRLQVPNVFSYPDLATRSIAFNPIIDSLSKKIAFYNPSKSYRKYNYISRLMQNANIAKNIIPKEFNEAFYKAMSSQEKIISSVFSVTNSIGLASKKTIQANILSQAFFNISNSILAQTLKFKSWNSLETIQPFYDKITALAEAAKDHKKNNSKFLIAFEDLKKEVSTSTEPDIKRDNKYLLNAFFNLISIAGFVVALYSLYFQLSDISNKEETLKLTKSSQQEKQEILKHIDTLFDKNKKARLIFNAPIKSKPISNSYILCGGKLGETITIMDSFKKYFLVIYKSDESYYPISGWILKKHVKYE